MSHASHRFLSVLIPFFALIALAGVLGLAVCAGSAYAVDEPYIDEASGTVRLVYNKYQNKEFNQFYILNSDDEPDMDLKANVKNLKSSNTKVLTVKLDHPTGIKVQLKKPGTAKVTYKYNGKKHTVKYIVKKYENPVATFKVGKKNYASKYKKTDRYENPIGEVRAKVSVVPAKNWKLKSIWATDESQEETKVKNNTKATVESLSLTLVNKKTKIEQKLFLNLYDYGD